MLQNTPLYSEIICAKWIRTSDRFASGGTRKSTLDLIAAIIWWSRRGKLLRREFGGSEDV